MKCGKQGFKGFGAAIVAAMVLMACVASAAQAHEWLLQGKAIASNTMAGGEPDVTEFILIPSRDFKIKCAKFSFAGAELIKGTNEGHATILLEECKTFSIGTGAELAKCHIFDPVTGKLHITVKVKYLLKLHPGQSALYIEVDPLTGSTYSTVHFLSGIGCSLPLLSEVTGSLALELDGENVATQKSAVKHLLKPYVNQALYGGGLKYGTHAAIQDGSAWVFLTGVDTGMLWGMC